MYKFIADESNFVVISKDHDVDFHGAGLISKIKEDLEMELYPVHRLDRITSGLLLLAKSSEAAKKLSDLFSNKTIKKVYMALGNKKPTKKMGLIQGDLKKTRNGSYRLIRTLENPSITRFESYHLKDSVRLFILRPITGKTHQLRVVMKSIGSSILGDMRYGDSEADRGYLHCYRLQFKLDDTSYNFHSYPDSGNYFKKYETQIKEIINGKSV